jgi:hypothetical protein
LSRQPNPQRRILAFPLLTPVRRVLLLAFVALHHGFASRDLTVQSTPLRPLSAANGGFGVE